MINTPSVCVYILIFNDEVFSCRAIDSVLAQSHLNLQVKILENGSTDATRRSINKYRSDNRVEIFCNNINLRSEFATHMARQTTADYISFLFSDDYYMPDRVEQMLLEIKDNDAIFSSNLYIDENGRTLSKAPRYIPAAEQDISLMTQDEHLYHLFHKGNPVHPCSMLIRGNTYKELGGFRGYYHSIGDMVFFAKLFASRRVRFLSDNLQAITVWTNKRNLGAANNHSHEQLLFERQMMLEEFMSPSILEKIEKIFTSQLHFIPENLTHVERLWILGQQALKVDSIDYRMFGIKCLYRAAEFNEEETNRLSQVAYGCSFGTYVENIPMRLSLQQLSYSSKKNWLKRMESSFRHWRRGIS